MSKKEKFHQIEPGAKSTPESSASPQPGEEPEGKDGSKSATAAEPVPEQEGSPEVVAAIAALEKQLAEAQSLAGEYKDGWQRSVADFQNYRRRVDADNKDTYQNAIGSIVKRYLPILDDLERALAARPADLAWVDGIELIYRKLKSILEAEGLKRI